MSLNRFTKAWLALAVAALLTGTAVADDRNFLRQLNAPPNLIFILDTSGSMVGTPEVPGTIKNAAVPYGMVPGGGDDPYSRMGIAKAVLREFLEDVDANYVLAGYAQGKPAAPADPVPRKHWVYEGIGVLDGGSYRRDHFGLMEQNYAYRIGWTESFSGILLNNPADILQSEMIGYKPYFDPADALPPDQDKVADRYGPTSAYDVDPARPYDLMPMYLGFTCFNDDMGTPAVTGDDVTRCSDKIFPFYDTGLDWPDGSAVVDMWYYGPPGGPDSPTSFPNCTAWKTPTANDPDDGCLTNWYDQTATVPGFIGRKVEFKRRVRLEVPDVNPTDSNLSNHPLGILDPDGVPMTGDEVPIGNEKIADLGAEDYDMDGDPTNDKDYDGDPAYDWIMYVDSVEQLKMRDAGVIQTPTDTPTETPTETPTATVTPTPVLLDCSLFTLDDPLRRSSSRQDRINLEVDNRTGYDAYLVSTYIDWQDTENQSSNPYINNLRFDGECDDQYWHNNFTNHPAIAVPPYSAGSGDCLDSEVAIYKTRIGDQDWDAYLNTGQAWVGDICVQLDFQFPEVGGLFCTIADCVSYSNYTPTVTPTFTASPTLGPPTNTYTPTYTPTGPTRTPTPTFTASPTAAAAATNTYTPTYTSPPSPPTNTPEPAPPTNTPTNTPNIDD